MKLTYGGVEMIVTDDGTVELSVGGSDDAGLYHVISREFCGAGGCPKKPQLDMLIHLLQTAKAELQARYVNSFRAEGGSQAPVGDTAKSLGLTGLAQGLDPNERRRT